MPRQCVFYLHGYRQYCEVVKALDREPMEEGEGERLRQSFCLTTNFMNCPLFKQLERKLARADLKLILSPAA
jgi:hypothetical protein